jgi:hypothetical protein
VKSASKKNVKHFIGQITRVISCYKREVRFVKMTGHATYTFSWPAIEDVSDVKCMTMLEFMLNQEHYEEVL